MKFVSIISILIFVGIYFFVKRTSQGKELIQHFYFQTFVMCALVLSLISQIIHFKLNLISVVMILILSSILATGLPHYIQKVKNRIGK